MFKLTFNHWCLLFLYLDQISNFLTSASPIAIRSSSRSKKKIESSSPSPSLLLESSKSLNKNRMELYLKIKALAIAQLNLDSNSNIVFNFTDYKILYWPDFVPISRNYWDEKSIEEIREVLYKLIFIEKPKVDGKCPSKLKSPFECSLNRSKINLMLLTNFNQQLDKSVHRISWEKYHLQGWPVGVSLHSGFKHWTSVEVQKIARGINNIFFVPINLDELRTVTYTDGVCKVIEADETEVEDNHFKNIQRVLPVNPVPEAPKYFQPVQQHLHRTQLDVSPYLNSKNSSSAVYIDEFIRHYNPNLDDPSAWHISTKRKCSSIY